jgi:competence protein ComFC
MIGVLGKIKEGILNLLIPKKCLGCGKEGGYICKNCELFLSELPVISTSLMKEAKPLSVWEYEGLIEKAIWKIKYSGCYDIIGELLEKALEKVEINLPEDAAITYVPMYNKKERKRGFNQSKIIAEKLGEKTNRPVVNLLEKIKDNRSQVGLDPQERQENVRNVFMIKMTEVKLSSIKTVLLVDDVYTTGATMSECIKVLKKAGFKNIYGFTLARRIRL